MPKHLFSDYNLYAVLENQKKRMAEAIDEAAAEELRGRSLEELERHFAEQYTVAYPEITEGAISASVEETQVDVSQDRNRAVFDRNRPCYVPGIVASYYVPFTGDHNIFLCQPNTAYSLYPIAQLGSTELVFRFQNADSDVGQTKRQFDEQVQLVRNYLGHAKRDIEGVNAQLSGVAKARLAGRMQRFQKIGSGLEALGLPVRGPGQALRAAPPPPHVLATAQDFAASMYDVAFTFAGEDREYVEEVATLLKESGVSVFYDKFEVANLWGKNLIDHLAEIYQKKSKYVVMFISEHYTKKPWPTHERTHAQARALLAREEYILPARFDDTEVPGLAGTVGYVSLKGMSPEVFADLVKDKIAKRHA